MGLDKNDKDLSSPQPLIGRREVIFQVFPLLSQLFEQIVRTSSLDVGFKFRSWFSPLYHVPFDQNDAARWMV